MTKRYYVQLSKQLLTAHDIYVALFARNSSCKLLGAPWVNRLHIYTSILYFFLGGTLEEITRFYSCVQARFPEVSRVRSVTSASSFADQLLVVKLVRFQCYMSFTGQINLKARTKWSPLGTWFKFLTGHPRSFHMHWSPPPAHPENLLLHCVYTLTSSS